MAPPSPDLVSRLDALLLPVRSWAAEGGAAPLWLLGLAALVGVVLGLGPWHHVRLGVTLFHELGHALASVLVGGSVRSLRLAADTSGVTHWSYAGSPGRLRTAWVAWWGYPLPGLVGGASILFALSPWARLWSAGLLLLLSFVLLAWVRGLWGVVVTGLVVVVGGVLVLSGAPGAAVLAVLAGAFLGVGGLRSTFEHLSEPRSGSSDSEVVSRSLFLPRRLVQFSFVLATLLLPAGLSALLG